MMRRSSAGRESNVKALAGGKHVILLFAVDMFDVKLVFGTIMVLKLQADL